MPASDATHEVSLEQLRETMVDLERARRHERQLRFESEGLLEGLQALTEAHDTTQVFDHLSRVLRRFVPFEDAFMLLASGADELRPVRATSPVFEGLVWHTGQMLRRVLGGNIVCVFDIGQVPEWQQQPAAVRNRVHSVIHAPLRTETRNAVLVFVHSQPACFTTDHVRLLERFAPLGNQALASIEYRQRLEAQTRELRAANEALQTTHLQLLQSEKMASIGQLAAGVAHEINNPVGFVLSNLGSLAQYVQELLEVLSAYEGLEAALLPSVPALTQVHDIKAHVDLDYLKQDVIQLLQESRDGCIRVRNIVQDLKDFSRVGSTETWQLANVETGLDSTINIGLNEFKHHIEVVKEYGGVPDIECLPSQLNQVFLNLIVNAAQSIERQGRIRVRTSHDGEAIWVEIVDNGRGISPANVSRIFDPFYTTKPVGQGTGLGLSLSYGIVQKHHGRIEVDSEPGRGSRFRIWLPIRRIEADGEGPQIGPDQVKRAHTGI